MKTFVLLLSKPNSTELHLSWSDINFLTTFMVPWKQIFGTCYRILTSDERTRDFKENNQTGNFIN